MQKEAAVDLGGEFQPYEYIFIASVLSIQYSPGNISVAMYSSHHPLSLCFDLALHFIYSVSEFSSEFKVIPPPVTQSLLCK